MAETSFTDAQQRALMWLPGDGSWRKFSGIDFLTYCDLVKAEDEHPEFFEFDRLHAGADEADNLLLRLTSAGIEARRQIAKEARG